MMKSMPARILLPVTAITAFSETEGASGGQGGSFEMRTGAPQGGKRPAGEPFDPNWMNYFDDANFYRYNRDLYNFPAGYADRSFTVRKNWSEPNSQDVLTETRLNPAPTTPIGMPPPMNLPRKVRSGSSEKRSAEPP